MSASASHPAPDDGGVTDDALPNKKDVKTEGGKDVHPFWQTATESTREEDMRRKKEWRAPEDVIATLRAAAKRYEGSHNFHNFTVGRESKDRSCFRYMKKIEVCDFVSMSRFSCLLLGELLIFAGFFHLLYSVM